MKVASGTVVSLWIDTNLDKVGLAVMVQESNHYLVHTVHDSKSSAGYHHLLESLQIDLDSDNIVYN